MLIYQDETERSFSDACQCGSGGAPVGAAGQPSQTADLVPVEMINETAAEKALTTDVGLLVSAAKTEKD